jgi:iduronate 2-sulfatase
LTGLYPTPTRFVDYKSRVDDDAPGFTTIPRHFRENGYRTAAVGKIFHHPDDGLEAWSDLTTRPDYPNSLEQQELWRDYQAPENEATKQSKLPLGAAGPAWEAADVPDSIYYDGKTTNMALRKLDDLADDGNPFFFGVGFIRPHLPFNAPKKYWDLYQREEIELPNNYFMPENAPEDAWFNYGELRSYTNIPNDSLPLSNETTLALRHGYYASVSYIDAQIGQIIGRLKELGLYENTIIVLWGDHGWSLGEHTLWCKHSCFNNALRAPVIMKAPEISKGSKTESLFSYVDIFPTLCDLAQIQKPEHLDGKSNISVLNDPAKSVNSYVFSRWQKGETVKTDRYCYTEYYEKTGEIKSRMLYDHQTDPDENINIVDNPKLKSVVDKLSALLQEHVQNRKI